MREQTHIKGGKNVSGGGGGGGGGGETSLQRHSLSLEDVNSSMESRNPRVSRVKLPKLSFKKFGGDITFWDSFHSAVHSNEDLSNVDKFNYLISFLEGSVAECISGLTLTSANYEEAVAVLLSEDLETSNR